MKVSQGHGALIVLGNAIAVAVAQDDVPPVDQFLRRCGGRLSLIDSHIYYDGGEVSQENFTIQRHSNPLNTTLSIDLSKSWRPDSVEMTRTSRPTDTPVMYDQAILTDSRAKAFYVWGGITSWSAPLRPPTLWRFDAASDGKWDDTRRSSNNEVFVEIKRAQNPAYASTPDAGFIFGGTSVAGSSPDPSGNRRGYISFEFATRTWEEHAEAPYSDDGTIWGGSATYVPGFGPNGLVFVMGGMHSRGEQPAKYIDFGTLHFLDPVTRKWYSQATTGDVPGERHQHCVGGAAGANGTFDIFIYGGTNQVYQKGYGDVHVLSLPGFRWKMVHDDSANDRTEHACAVIGTGNRQLLSWGGRRTHPAGESWQEWKSKVWESPDPFPQGLGIFDMSELVWKSEYDADAEAYRAHDSVSSCNMDSVQWSSSAVKSLFVKEEPADEADDSGITESSPASTPIGPIVGGVVGGVIALALIATAIWFFCLRKRVQAPVAAVEPCRADEDSHEHQKPVAHMSVHQDSPQQGPYSIPELHGATVAVEMMGSEKWPPGVKGV